VRHPCTHCARGSGPPQPVNRPRFAHVRLTHLIQNALRQGSSRRHRRAAAVRSDEPESSKTRRPAVAPMLHRSLSRNPSASCGTLLIMLRGRSTFFGVVAVLTGTVSVAGPVGGWRACGCVGGVSRFVPVASVRVMICRSALFGQSIEERITTLRSGACHALTRGISAGDGRLRAIWRQARGLTVRG
jgi:hypothetical protein